ncbi:MAG: type II toxin-antitoxin system HicB family antitoxin [Candidatus Caenarcaniphilales bacterium]|nr:type II toxin-antitoxin system HicB family antitoxin [Candidatus Caenarcaniphilales bacterium]
MKIKVEIYEAEEGGYWAKVPALEGCCSQGETIEELKVNIVEAIEGWLECQTSMNEDKNENIKELELVI